MKKIKYYYTLAVVLLAIVVGMSAGRCGGNSGDGALAVAEVEDSAVIMLRTTPVKDQGQTPTCWIHAMLACIETDRIEQYGDSLNLSPLWLMRKLIDENELRARLLRHSSILRPAPEADEDGVLTVTGKSMRGVGPDALRLIDHYGLIPDKTRPGRNEGFYLYSMHYTPREFGRSVYQPGDWEWYTSFTHHEYGEMFALEVPDNYHYNEFRNVEPAKLLALTVSSLRARHPVFWEGQPFRAVPKGKRDRKTGLAAADNSVASQRQALFEKNVLTDAHAMAIVGMDLRSDKTHRPHFIVKNSWGKEWGRGGYGKLYVDEFLFRTIAVGVRDVVGESAQR